MRKQYILFLSHGFKTQTHKNKHCLNSLTIEHLGFVLNKHLFRSPKKPVLTQSKSKINSGGKLDKISVILYLFNCWFMYIVSLLQLTVKQRPQIPLCCVCWTEEVGVGTKTEKIEKKIIKDFFNKLFFFSISSSLLSFLLFVF